MAVTARLQALFTAQQTDTIQGGAASFNLNLDPQLSFTNGTAANQVNQLWSDERTIAASSSEEIDLAGALTDALGDDVEMVELVALIVIASSSNVNDVVVGGSGSTVPIMGGTNPTFAVGPGAWHAFATPGAGGHTTITPSSGDILKVANSGSGSSITFTIAALGRSA